MTGFEGLIESIHEATGATGKDLEQATFFAAAVYADFMDRSEIGDYFMLRMQESSSKQ